MEFEKSSLCRVMVFENFIEAGNLGFGKMILVGNLSWAVSTLEKTGQKPKITPPQHVGGGRLFYRLKTLASAKRSKASPT